MRVFLARHGETEWNVLRRIQGHSDIPLNENGIRQAHELAQRLAGSGITCVYTSRLSRAIVTGQIVAESLGVPCVQRDGLQEIGMGDWEGGTWADVRRDFPELSERLMNDRRNTRPPNGETYGELILRAGRAAARIIAENSGDVLIVAHGGCIQALMAELNGTPIETAGKDYPMPNASVVEPDARLILERFG